MHSIREELEDLSFAETEPEIRGILFERIKKSKRRNNKIVKDIEKIISARLNKDSLEVKVIGREKTVYSIWKKLENKNRSLEQISDLFAFRIYVEDLFDCYKVLGVLHNNWQAVPGLFKDYISTPKKNGYQSIHTTLIGPRNRRIEIQIRTNKMHEFNEKGLAAHWAYKEKGNANDQYLASMAIQD